MKNLVPGAVGIATATISFVVRGLAGREAAAPESGIIMSGSILSTRPNFNPSASTLTVAFVDGPDPFC